MNLNVKQALIENKIRENSGSISSGRFDYQKDWSICKLLEEHDQKRDYVLVFEFHEDLLILDSEKNPTKIRFYQIKTKSGNWTINALIKQEKGEAGDNLPSILGKLYSNKAKFNNSAESFHFVSNAVYSTKLSDGSLCNSKRLICIKELSQKDIESINKSLCAEYNLQKPLSCEESIFLVVSDLSLNDHDTHTLGKLAKFLESLSPGNYNVNLIYKTLFEEVKRKSNYDGQEIKSFDELIKYKSISRAEFNRIIITFLATKDQDYDDGWKSLEGRLNSEAFTIQEINRYKTNYRIYTVNRTNPSNAILEAIVLRMKEIISIMENKGQLDTSLEECLKLLIDEYDLNPIDQDLYSKDYLKVVALDLIYNG